MTTVQNQYKAYIKQNMYEKYKGTNKCSTNNCSNSCNLKNRRYKSSVRVPLKGYRKTINCNAATNKHCFTYQEVFRDNYANASTTTRLCPSNSTSGNYSRTNKPLIKSGLMPNKSGTAKSDAKNKYAYSYSERMRNLKKTTYERNLPKNSSKGGHQQCFNGELTQNSDNTPCNTIIQNYNNKKYYQQGAVSSSTRLERLKLNAKAMAYKCTSTSNNCDSKCCYDKSMFVNRIIGPKDVYGSNECTLNSQVHKNALFKARGAASKQC